MYLIEPLVTGFGAAPSGTAEIYQFGTLTPATVYSDYQGLTAVSGPHTLNSSGQLVRYVNEVVDVIVKSTSGSTISSFTCGGTAHATELRHAIATGTSATGQSGAGLEYRTTVANFLTNLYNSLGAADGKVSVSGSPQNIKDAIAGTTGVFYNVLSSSYGAVGDDSTDDTAGIQAAITAAQDAGGGIVFFPPKVYKITGSLLVGGPDIWLLGCPGATLKQYTTGINGWVDVDADYTRIDNIIFDKDTTGRTGNCIRVRSGATEFKAFGCVFTGHNAADIDMDSTRAAFNDCKFTMTEASSAVIAGGGARFNGCWFDVQINAQDMFGVGPNVITGGTIHGSGAAGTATLVNGASPILTLSGVNFPATGGMNVFIVGSSATSPDVWEGGCRFADGSINTSGGMKYSQWRDHTTLVSTGNTTYTPNVGLYGIHDFEATSGAGLAFANPAANAATVSGQPLTILFKNSSGSNFAPTFGTAYRAPAITVSNTERCGYFFRYNATESRWICVAAGPVYTA